MCEQINAENVTKKFLVKRRWANENDQAAPQTPKSTTKIDKKGLQPHFFDTQAPN